MNDHDLPLEPDPTPEERRRLEQLSAWLDDWSADVAERVPLPTEPSGTDRERMTIPSWLRGPHAAAALIAASVVTFLLLPDPGVAPVDPPSTTVAAIPGVALQALDLEVESPHPYMLVPTRDPSISIVWILDTDTHEGD